MLLNLAAHLQAVVQYLYIHARVAWSILSNLPLPSPMCWEQCTFSPGSPGGPRGPVMPMSPADPFKPWSPVVPFFPLGPCLIVEGGGDQELPSNTAVSGPMTNLISNVTKFSHCALESYQSLPTDRHSDTVMRKGLKLIQAYFNPRIVLLSFLPLEPSITL